MADSAVPSQEAGGGEGPGPVPTCPSDLSVEVTKSTDTIILEDTKNEVSALPDATPVPSEEEVKPAEQLKTNASEPLADCVAKAPENGIPKVETPEVGSPKVEAPKNETPKIETPEAPKLDEALNETDDWQKREQELLKKIEDLEKVKSERTEDGFKLELKVKEQEVDLLKARVRNLETELQAAMSKPAGKNHEMIESIKLQHQDLISKARGMIFDKTKMVKNQELQIQALTTQVQSLKDINQITKDLLEIRNSEIKAMEDRLQVMEERFKTEKERFGLVLQRAQTSTTINDDLRKEYETQLAIFRELRERYEQRVQALQAENNRLKESVQGGQAPS